MTHDEEEEGSVSSQASRARRMAQSTKKKFGSVLKRVKKKKGGDGTPSPSALSKSDLPPSHIHTDATADTSMVSPISSSGEEETSTPKEEQEEVAVVEEEEEEETSPRDLSVVYEDDNDGSKEKQCCGECACTMM